MLSNFINPPVENFHKIEFSLRDNAKSTLTIPKDITVEEAKIIKGIIDALILEK